MSMDTLPVLVCNKIQFQAIYQNLSLLGSSEHENLKIYEDENKYCYPVTQKKGWYETSNLEKKVIQLTFAFFEKNIGRLAEESQPHTLLTKLEPFANDSIEKNRLYMIRQELFNLLALKSTEQQRTLLIQEADNRVQELKKQRTLLIQEADNRVQELEKQMAALQVKISELEDTLIVCENASLSVHKQKLIKVSFFATHFKHIEMEKTSLTSSEKKHYKYKFDFSEFHSRTVSSLIDWMETPSKLASVKDFNSLFDLYRLADFVDDADFRAACLKQIDTRLNEKGKLRILTLAEYTSGDELITSCCTVVASQFQKLIKNPLFLQIKAEYFLKIIKDENVNIDNAEKGVFAIIEWAESTAKRTGKSTSELLYEVIEGDRIIDYIPFGSLSQTTFASKILPLKILSTESTLHWLEFHIKNRPEPLKNFSNLQVKAINKNEIKVTYRIPIEVFLKIGDWEQGKVLITNFSFEEHKFSIKLGKKCINKQQSLIIALRLNSLKKDFDFFLSFGEIHYFSAPKQQTDTTEFTNQGISPDGKIKGYDYRDIDNFNLSGYDKFIPLKMHIFVKNHPPELSKT